MLSIVTALVPLALAGTPHTVTLSSMTEQDGVAVLDQDLLSSAYETLITELGAGVAQPATHPARTLGAGEWEFTLSQQFLFIEARLRDGPSPWERSHPDETPPNVLTIPTLEAHIGLPLSAEVSFRTGWIAGPTPASWAVALASRSSKAISRSRTSRCASSAAATSETTNSSSERPTSVCCWAPPTKWVTAAPSRALRCHRGHHARGSPSAQRPCSPTDGERHRSGVYRNDSEDITAPGPIKPPKLAPGFASPRAAFITLGANGLPTPYPPRPLG